MDPDMLEPLPAALEKPSEYIYALTVQCNKECGVNQLGVSSELGALLREMTLDLESYEAELVLTHTHADIDGWRFVYEAKDPYTQDLYLYYYLHRTPILNGKGGYVA